MKNEMNVVIKPGTDLNQIIKNISSGNEYVTLNEEQLKFDPSIYLDLPFPLDMISKAIDEPQQKDMALLTCLTVLGSLLKNYTVDHRGKVEGCQLCTYILGNASAGKGFVHTFKGVGAKYHKHYMDSYRTSCELYQKQMKKLNSNGEVDEMPVAPDCNYLFISPNTTKAALVQELCSTGGFGLLFAPEADTLFQSTKGEHGGFSDLLRTAFQGEEYSVNRKEFGGLPREIKSVRMGILLTSTVDQCFKLIPTYENGLFSRFIFYLLSTNNRYKAENLNSSPEDIQRTIDEIGGHYFNLATKLSQTEAELSFAFTQDQLKRRDAILLREDERLFIQHGSRLQSSVNRMSLIFTRFCMLLSLLRHFENVDIMVDFEKNIKCDERDFNTAMAIVLNLINHLQILDSVYETKNAKQRGLAFLPQDTSGDEPKGFSTAQLKKEALNMRLKNLSYGQIAKSVLGDEKLKGTVYKWVKKESAGKSAFPFPETETVGNIINVEKVLGNTGVSVFANVRASEPEDGEVSLLDLAISSEYKEEIEKYRKMIHPDKKAQMKKKLPAYTASGSFEGRRNKANLHNHSGFICLDIDQKENTHIANFPKLKTELANVRNVAFCGHSVSGKGYYLLIPIKDPQQHEIIFDHILSAFKSLGINLDKSCRDVSRLRIISYDENPYVARNAVQVEAPITSPTPLKVPEILPASKNPNLDSLVNKIVRNELDITEIYQDWFAIGCGLANDLGESGREHFHKISQFYRKYTVEETNLQFTACLSRKREKTDRYTLKSVFYIAQQAGVF